MDNQRGHRDLAKRLGSIRAGQNRCGLTGDAGRAEAARHTVFDQRSANRLVEGRAANPPDRCNRLLDRISQRWLPAARHLDHEARGNSTVAFVAGIRHDRGKASHLFGVTNGERLRNHAAHRHADHVGRCNAQRVEEARRIVGHIGQQVASARRSAKQRSEHCPNGTRRFPVELRRQPHVAVIERDDLEPTINELGNEIRVPVAQLSTKPMHQKQRLTVAVDFVFDGDSVGGNRGHSHYSSCGALGMVPYAPDMSHIDGKIAIVTGAVRGLGAAYAVALSDAGATVITCDVQPGCDAIVDVADGDAIKAFVDEVVAAHGPIGILIANAGVCKFTNPLDPWEQAEADFDFHIGTNLRGLYLTGRAVLPSMVGNGGGHLVLICTDHTCRPDDWPYTGGTLDSYDASKWGVLGLTTSWASALAPKGVRVNAVSMGATDTEMLRSFIRTTTGKDPTAEVAATWMQPEQIAALVVELVEEGPTGRTGTNIPVIVGRPIALP